MRIFFLVCAVFCIIGCPVPENNMLKAPIQNITVRYNKNPIHDGITILEGRSVILEALLTPVGVQGGVHWESSSGDILELNSLFGQQITITGKSGGSTVVLVTARNTFNELPIHSECRVTVIPRSFFKWNYKSTDWIDVPVLDAGTNHYLYDAGFPVLVRAVEADIYSDPLLGGIVLEGEGARLVIGSGMARATNDPFAAALVYDENGQFNFLDGPADYSLWAGRTRISLDYEILDSNTQKSLLKIQVNNNTNERLNASAINNWLVAELTPASPRSGTLTGIFNNAVSILTENDGTDLNKVLSNSFICLALPSGKILIRSITIESAD